MSHNCYVLTLSFPQTSFKSKQPLFVYQFTQEEGNSGKYYKYLQPNVHRGLMSLDKEVVRCR